MIKTVQYLMAFGLLIQTFCLVISAQARALPILLNISSLSSIYYERRIVVMGWAADVEPLTGTRGGQYFKITITDGDDSVIVFSDFKIYNIKGERVIAQGKFKGPGRFAGFLTGRHIILDQIVRDWDWMKE